MNTSEVIEMNPKRITAKQAIHRSLPPILSCVVVLVPGSGLCPGAARCKGLKVLTKEKEGGNFPGSLSSLHVMPAEVDLVILSSSLYLVPGRTLKGIVCLVDARHVDAGMPTCCKHFRMGTRTAPQLPC